MSIHYVGWAKPGWYNWLCYFWTREGIARRVTVIRLFGFEWMVIS
jgi:hypothetical protein